MIGIQLISYFLPILSEFITIYGSVLHNKYYIQDNKSIFNVFSKILMDFSYRYLVYIGYEKHNPLHMKSPQSNKNSYLK